MKYARIDIARDQPCMHRGLQGQGSWPLRARQHGRGPGRVPKAARKWHGKLVAGCEAAGHTWPSRAARARRKGSGSRSAARTRRGSSGRRPARTTRAMPKRSRTCSGAAPFRRAARRPGDRPAEEPYARRHCARARQDEALQQALRAARKVRLAPAGGQDPLEKAPTRVRNTAFGNHADSTSVRRLVRQIGSCNREIGLAEKDSTRGGQLKARPAGAAAGQHGRHRFLRRDAASRRDGRHNAVSGAAESRLHGGHAPSRLPAGRLAAARRQDEKTRRRPQAKLDNDPGGRRCRPARRPPEGVLRARQEGARRQPRDRGHARGQQDGAAHAGHALQRRAVQASQRGSVPGQAGKTRQGDASG